MKHIKGFNEAFRMPSFVTNILKRFNLVQEDPTESKVISLLNNINSESF